MPRPKNPDKPERNKRISCYEKRLCRKCQRMLLGGSKPWLKGICSRCLAQSPDENNQKQGETTVDTAKKIVNLNNLTVAQRNVFLYLCENNNLLPVFNEFDQNLIKKLAEEGVLEKTELGYRLVKNVAFVSGN